MSNYTGPVTIVIYQGQRDRFAMVYHSEDEMRRISPKIEADGYKIDKQTEHQMVNGSLVRPAEKNWSEVMA